MSSEENCPHRQYVLVELPFTIPSSGDVSQASACSAVSSFISPTTLALNSILASHAGDADSSSSNKNSTSRLDMSASVVHSTEPVGRIETTGPRLLSCVHARNDALLKVTRKFIRRKRRREDGTVEVTEIPVEGEQQLEWLGVVSRASTIAKPVDFYFDNTSSERRASAAFACPPDWFIPPFLPSAFPYYYQKGQRRGATKDTSGEQAQVLVARGDAVRSQDVAMDCELPPSQWPQHTAYIDSLRRTNSPEVTEIEELLKKKPVWRMSDLYQAMAASGRCPRLHTNVEVIRTATYSILQGPFSRLRIRYGFDPTRTRDASPLQRVALRWGPPTMPMAILIRDCSRAPQLRSALAAIAAEEAAAVGERSPQPFPSVWTTTKVFSACVLKGSLFHSCQLNDLMDDSFLSHELGDPLVVCNAQATHGWFRESVYRRCTSHISDAFASFIKFKLIPKLRAEQQRERIAAPTAEDTPFSGTGEERDDGDDDETASMSRTPSHQQLSEAERSCSDSPFEAELSASDDDNESH